MLTTIPIVDKLIMDLEKTRMDDLVDRAHYMFTVIGLLFAMMIIGAKQIFGEPIRCMVAAEYPGPWMNYVNEYCFITSTFVSDAGSSMFNSDDPFDQFRRVDISYYQWVPYALLAMAFFFYLPHFVWSRCQDTADIDFRAVVDESMKVRSELDQKKHDQSIGRLVNYIKQAIYARREQGTVQDGLGFKASLGYMVSKVVALINVLVQFQLLSMTVGRGNIFWGFKIVWDLMNGIYWDKNGFFPRMSYCEWTRETLSNNQTRVAQCALMVNMLNEKIFTVVYFWFLLLLVATLANLVYRALFTFCPHFRSQPIDDYLTQLTVFAPKCPYDESRMRKFVEDKLGLDGLLMLNFVEGHAGWLTTAELTCRLFNSFYGPIEETITKDVPVEEDKNSNVSKATEGGGEKKLITGVFTLNETAQMEEPEQDE